MGVLELVTTVGGNTHVLNPPKANCRIATEVRADTFRALLVRRMALP